MLIERLGRLRSLSAEVQLRVHVVLDEGHVVPLQELDQLLASIVGHQRAQWVLEIGHEPTRAHCVLIQNARQVGDIDAMRWVRRDLDSLEPESLDGLKAAIERWRLDRHQVAWPGQGLQRKV